MYAEACWDMCLKTPGDTMGSPSKAWETLWERLKQYMYCTLNADRVMEHKVIYDLNPNLDGYKKVHSRVAGSHI